MRSTPPSANGWTAAPPSRPGVAARARTDRANAQTSLAFLCELLQLDEADILDLRYQLLHRTATAILEAQRFAAHHSLMLVHSFSAKDAWLNDYQAFAQRMGGTGPRPTRSPPSASAVKSPSTSGGCARRRALDARL
jgi:hypothetical protein